MYYKWKTTSTPLVRGARMPTDILTLLGKEERGNVIDYLTIFRVRLSY
jgi:hypothetical protein